MILNNICCLCKQINLSVSSIWWHNRHHTLDVQSGRFVKFFILDILCKWDPERDFHLQRLYVLPVCVLLQLLLFISGTKEKYRQLRDLHAVESHLQTVTELCKEGGLDINEAEVTPAPIVLNYDTLLNIVRNQAVPKTTFIHYELHMSLKKLTLFVSQFFVTYWRFM